MQEKAEEAAEEKTQEMLDLEGEGFTIVKSSALLAVKWKECEQDDPCGEEDGHLTVQFHRTKKTPDVPGARWEYEGVSRGTFEGMLNAAVPDSVGKFFAREIKARKHAWKLEPKA